MKHIKIIAIVFIICLSFSACSRIESQRTDFLGFNTTEFSIIEEKDTHGGFRGDGSYYLILDCSENPSQVREVIKDWKELPFPENLGLVMYGGEKDGVIYAHNFAEEAHWSTIRNGVYKFIDRHSEAVNPSDETNLLNRYSFNFSIAVYDLDNDILYYFEKDS